MNERETFIEVMNHRRPGRIPFAPGHGRESTLKAWHSQGLPPEVTDYLAHVRELIGIEPAPKYESVDPGVDFQMIPQFEEKVIERRPGTLVVRDWKGNICEISDQFDVRYLRSAIDFVTRTWLKCPVENRADWADMARRYDPNDPGRFPKDWACRCAAMKDRQYVSSINISGPFWQLREWLGFENLCMLLLDDPDFAMEMIRFYEQYMCDLLQRMLRDHVPDHIVVSEDMAYKEKPMISPDMARKFLLPTWRRWADICRSAGVAVYEVDSDGYVESLIPVWIDAGFVANSPVEVAAGNDLPKFSRTFGRHMAYCGGVDKREMARGGRYIRAEIDRLRPAIDAGGYIPGCDHGVPSDVSWPNYVDYCRLLAKATGWL